MRKYLLIVLLSFPGTGGYAGDSGTEQEYIRSLIRTPSSCRRDSLLITAFRKFWIKAGRENEKGFIDSCLREIAPEMQVSTWPPARAHYCYIQGSEYLRENRLYQAFDYLEKSLLEFRRLKDEKNVALVNNRFIPLMTWNMYENDIPEDAKAKYSTYFSEAFRLAENTGDLEVIANIKITWAAYTLFILKDYKESLRMTDEIFERIREQDKEKWFDYFHITLLGQSLSYLYLGETRKGEQLLEQVVNECFRRPGFNQAQYVLGQAAGFGGRYYLSRKEYKKALKYATLAENQVNFMEFPYFSNYLNKTLYEAYKHNGRAATALLYLEKVRAYEEESQVEKLNRGFAEWQLKYETEKYKNRITALENEKSKHKNRIVLTSLLIMVVAGVTGSVFIARNNRKLKQKNEELKQKNEEISKAIIKGQAIERKRVAYELHDNLNTKIAALKWRIESAEKLTPEQEAFVKILDDIYEDVRRISHNL